jgi:hypothetical protein
MVFGVIALVAGAMGWLLLREAAHMSFTKARVLNTKDPAVLTRRDMPGFVRQRPDSPRLAAFRKCIEGIGTTDCDALFLATQVRHWVRSLQSDSRAMWCAPFGRETEDPLRLLREIREGKPGSCRRFAYLLTGAALSVGLDARIVVASAHFDGRTPPHHCMVEVWAAELGKWVLLDPSFDATFCVDGQPATLLEVYFALQKGEVDRISLFRHGTSAPYLARVEYYRQAFKHIYVACSNAIFDGYHVSLVGKKRITFLHFVDLHVPPYPERRKQFLLVSGFVSLLLAMASLLYEVSAMLP